MPFSRKSLYAFVATAAVLAVCYHASIAPPVGAEFASGEFRAFAASANQENCADDVKIKVWDPADPQLNYNLKDPPDYSGDDEIRIYYDVPQRRLPRCIRYSGTPRFPNRRAHSQR